MESEEVVIVTIRSRHPRRGSQSSDEMAPPRRLPPAPLSDGEMPAASIRAGENRLVLELLADWKADTSGYDEATWPIVEKGLEANRLSSRRRVGE